MDPIAQDILREFLSLVVYPLAAVCLAAAIRYGIGQWERLPSNEQAVLNDLASRMVYAYEQIFQDPKQGSVRKGYVYQRLCSLARSYGWNVSENDINEAIEYAVRLMHETATPTIAVTTPALPVPTVVPPVVPVLSPPSDAPS